MVSPGLRTSYKALFGHLRPAMDAMCQLLRDGRVPSELIRRYATATTLPCGSGRKWKHCHQPAPVTRQDY